MSASSSRPSPPLPRPAGGHDTTLVSDSRNLLLRLVSGGVDTRLDLSVHAVPSLARLLLGGRRRRDPRAGGRDAVRASQRRDLFLVGSQRLPADRRALLALSRRVAGDTVPVGDLLRAGGLREPGPETDPFGPRIHPRRLRLAARVPQGRRPLRGLRVWRCRRFV